LEDLNIFIFSLLLFFLAVLAETNRVPFDLSESESELVAGFITEYSSVYYSIIVLTEYANIIALLLVMIILHSLPEEVLLFFLLLTSLTRSTLVRLKFDELMTNV
jgi:formate hydrogenlyase subunit 4